jgi:predicted transcriptional regulator
MKKLTAQEEEAMQVIWKCGGGYVKDFLERFSEPRPPYTTLASTVKNLERKGFVSSEKAGSTYHYMPLIRQQDYQKRFLNGFVEDYFKSSYKELVTFFAREKQISAGELKEIIDMIENRKPDLP